jgi:peptide methionine sulfoxide reductase MsrA
MNSTALRFVPFSELEAQGYGEYRSLLETFGATKTEEHASFWEAEPEHQDYLMTYPAGYTCHFVRPDWVLPRRTTTA